MERSTLLTQINVQHSLYLGSAARSADRTTQLAGAWLVEGCLCISNALEAGDLAHVRNLYVGPSQASVDGTECVQMVIDECSIGRTCHVFF